jgi:hypothetical protein
MCLSITLCAVNLAGAAATVRGNCDCSRAGSGYPQHGVSKLACSSRQLSGMCGSPSLGLCVATAAECSSALVLLL